MSEEIEDSGIAPAEAAEETESATVETTEETGEETAAAPQKAKGVQKRLDELTRIRHDAERDRDYWREMAMRNQQPPQQQAPEVATAAEATPKEDDFNDYNEFLRATARYEVRQEIREAQQRAVAEQQRRHAEERQRTELQTFEERRVATVDQGRAKYNDFEDVVFSLPGQVLTQEFAAAIFATETPADVAYYLGKNRVEAEKISLLPPLQKAAALGRIEAKLAAPKTAQPSKAPSPIRPVGGNEVLTNEPDSQKNPDAWLAWERARVAKQGRKY